MNLLQNLKIHQKLFLAIMAVVGLTLLLFVSGILWRQVALEKRMLVSGARELMEIAALNLMPAVMFKDASAAQEVMESMLQRRAVKGLEVFDANANRFNAIGEQVAPSPPNGNACAPYQFVADQLLLCRKLEFETETIGYFWLRMDLSEIQERQRLWLQNLLPVMVLALALSFWMGLRLSRRLSKPVRELTENLQNIRKTGDLGARVRVVGKDEIGQLAVAFNDMLMRLDDDIRTKSAMQKNMADMFYERESILAAIPDIAFKVVTGGRLVWWNPALEVTSGLDPLTLRKINLGELFDSSDSVRVSALFQKKEKSEHISFQALFKQADGQAPYEFVASWLPASGGAPEGYVAIGRDLSSQRKVEQLKEQLQRAQKMESIGRLTGGIAHDFNNMLAGILGYTQLACEHEVSARTPVLLKYLEQVNVSALRARDLVAQMLAFCRTEGKKDDVVELSLPDAIHEVIDMLRPALPSSIEISVKLSASETTVLFNAVQLHQVIMNLIINARDALQGEGSIDLSLQNTSIDSDYCSSCHALIDSASDYITVSVKDSGPGVDDEVKARMFEPFFTTKDIGKGTGMGLSVVHGIMHEHGGHIQVISEPGKGTDIRLLFAKAPVCAVQSMSKQKASTEESGGKVKGQVMIVDDELGLLSMLQELLGNRGYQVTVFDNPKEALGWFRLHARSVDLVMTDQTMPGMTGLRLGKELMGVSPGAKIILCSGFSEGLEPQMVTESGFFGFLGKPFDMDELLQMINSAMPDQERNRGEQS